MFDGVFNAIAQLGSDISNIGYDNYKTGREHRFAVRQQEYAQNFTREQMQNAHQWEVGDLKNAGLNPVLSASSGSQIGSSPVTTGSSVNTGRMVDLSSALLAYKQGKMYDEQAKNLKAEAALTASNAECAKVRSDLVQSYLDSLTPQQRADAGRSIVHPTSKISGEVSTASQLVDNWLGKSVRDFRSAIDAHTRSATRQEVWKNTPAGKRFYEQKANEERKRVDAERATTRAKYMNRTGGGYSPSSRGVY
ncbi:VP2 [Gokushovirus WZ-2015a]|nr:VP2 [Gokushovirus WZ-2015a]